jgi:acetylornithine deacetylase/succinyl-diaminopimelate desuccinylase-like protein
MKALLEKKGIQEGLRFLEIGVEDVLQEAIRICEIPAPTFAEAARGKYVAARMQAIGLEEITTDTVGNVRGVLPGNPALPTLLVMAHLDTVFGPEVPITVRRDAEHIYGPGISDNSLAIAAMLQVAQAMPHLSPEERGTLIFVANVGEEGLGDLRGAKYLWQTDSAQIDVWVALEGGMFGEAEVQGVGSRRLQISYHTESGHSWGAFGIPSAIHALGKLIYRISLIPVPTQPKTTFNVGLISGGISVNTIAPEAQMVLDMRSESAEALQHLENAVRQQIASVAQEDRVEAKITVVGDRPAGTLPADHWLVPLAENAAQVLGFSLTWKAGSTDINYALGQGKPAICLGISRGHKIHNVGEYVEIAPTQLGIKHTFLTLAALAAGKGKTAEA